MFLLCTASQFACMAYLCTCGSWCWGSTDGRSCRTGIPRTAVPCSGHGKMYRPWPCRRSGTGCHRLTSTGRSEIRSERHETAAGRNYISCHPYRLMWPLQGPLQICRFFFLYFRASKCAQAYADSLCGRCRSNRGDIWVRKDPKAKERCWQGRTCRTEAPPHCRRHMMDGTLWKNEVKKTELQGVIEADMFQTGSRMFEPR